MPPYKRRALVITVWGLMGYFYSRGMDVLAARANSILGVTGTLLGNSFFPVSGTVNQIVALCVAAAKRGEAIVLVGHSYGGYAVIQAANTLASMGIKVDLLVPVDTTVDSPMVGNTQGTVVEYFQRGDPMGGGAPNAVDPKKTPIIRHQEHVSHIQMDDLKSMQDDVIDRVRKLIAA